MKKLKLNKKTISVLDKAVMGQIDGGACIASCNRGTDLGKTCCNSGRIDVSLGTIISPTCTNAIIG